MNEKFLNIILIGWSEQPTLFKEYLFRTQKILERDEFITKKVFFANCFLTAEMLENEISRLILKRTQELIQITEHSTNAKTVKLVQDELDNFNPEKYFIQLSHFTNHKFTGLLYYNTILHLKKCITDSELNDINFSQPQQSEHELTVEVNEKISIKVIALLYWYNGTSITRENAKEIAEKYNYTAINSGEGLYQDYLFYSKKTNRLASGESLIKLNNKIKLFEKVVLLIDETEKSRVETEISTLKSKLHQYK